MWHPKSPEMKAAVVIVALLSFQALVVDHLLVLSRAGFRNWSCAPSESNGEQGVWGRRAWGLWR